MSCTSLWPVAVRVACPPPTPQINSSRARDRHEKMLCADAMWVSLYFYRVYGLMLTRPNETHHTTPQNAIYMTARVGTRLDPYYCVLSCEQSPSAHHLTPAA